MAADNSERRTVDGRWATFSGALLGVTVLAAELSGYVKDVFLGLVAFLTLLCSYGFARTFAPTRAFENAVKGILRERRRARHPFWSDYMHLPGTAVTPEENDVWLFRIPSLEPDDEYPSATNLKLRCEINRLFRNERVLCTDRRNLVNTLALMLVPSQFLDVKAEVTVLKKGRYVLRWYNEDAQELIMKERIRSWGHDPLNSWRTLQERRKMELKKLKGLELPTIQLPK